MRLPAMRAAIFRMWLSSPARLAHSLATADQAGDREVISAYERLWDKYQVLRDEVERSHSPGAHVDFKAVSEAFTDVAHDVREYSDADGSIYARGGFQHDPYYDLEERYLVGELRSIRVRRCAPGSAGWARVAGQSSRRGRLESLDACAD
jgi:hypothetical protein